MKINNRARALKFKRFFFLGSVIIALATLALFFSHGLIGGIGGIGIFSLWYLYFHVAEYLFIEFSADENKVILRYYKAIAFGRPSYNEIEFPASMLKNVRFENSIFGKKSDITLFVKTKRGVAEYPTVSLSAVEASDRQKISLILHDLLHS